MAHALFRLFEEAFGRHALYGETELDQQQSTIDALSDHITRLKAQIERLQAELSHCTIATITRAQELGTRDARH